MAAATRRTTAASFAAAARPTRTPKGCDTFVAFPPSTPNGVVIFGKNSDRPEGEKQSIRYYPATSLPSNNRDKKPTVQCTYMSIPQVPQTKAVLLSQIDWMWGAEHGANECGVVIGNEAVWTKVPEECCEVSGKPKRLLLGMDLLRLGLERSSSAYEAVKVITTLLETHGQGGPCAENDESFTYHNSFLIADNKEAWILETAGRHWVAEKVTRNRNISNTLTIRTSYTLSSTGLKDYAIQHKLWDGTTGDVLDWAKCFGEAAVEECESPFSRQSCGRSLLAHYDNDNGAAKAQLDHRAMMEILRDHKGGICMHGGGFETTASMVSELRRDGTARHWMIDKPHPCRHEYMEQSAFQEA